MLSLPAAVRRCAAALVLGAGLVSLVASNSAAPVPPSTEGQPGEVKLNVIKYRDLCSAIRQLRGRVVVVDIWGEF